MLLPKAILPGSGHNISLAGDGRYHAGQALRGKGGENDNRRCGASRRRPASSGGQFTAGHLGGSPDIARKIVIIALGQQQGHHHDDIGDTAPNDGPSSIIIDAPKV